MTDKMPDEIYISQDREYPDTWRDVSWGFENAPLKYISEQKHAEEIAAKQSIIDRLMLEYCPEDMTEEQLAEYERNQAEDK